MTGLSQMFVLVTFTYLIFVVQIMTEESRHIFHRESIKSILKIGDAKRVVLQELLGIENLCSVLKEKFSLLYLNENRRPEVHLYKFELENEKKMLETEAVHCHTLPSTYLRPGKSRDEIIVSMFRSIAERYEFDSEDDFFPLSINLFVFNKSLSDNLPELNLHERQDLCIEARKHLAFVFVDNYVIRPLMYEFTYRRETRIYNAILCPTYPPTYLHFHKGENRITILYFRTEYGLEIVEDIRPKKETDEAVTKLEEELLSVLRKFEGGAINLLLKGQEEAQREELNRKLFLSLEEEEIDIFCWSASLYIQNTTTLQMLVGKPSLYVFEYPNGSKRERLAIRCLSTDDMYIYFEDFNGRIQIKIALRKSNLMD